MSIADTFTSVVADQFASLAPSTRSLAQRLSHASPEQIEQITEDFEGIFLSLLLKEMRQTLDGGFFGEDGSDIYGGLFDLTMGRHMAQSSPLGVGDMITRYVDVARE